MTIVSKSVCQWRKKNAGMEELSKTCVCPVSPPTPLGYSTWERKSWILILVELKQFHQERASLLLLFRLTKELIVIWSTNFPKHSMRRRIEPYSIFERFSREKILTPIICLVLQKRTSEIFSCFFFSFHTLLLNVSLVRAQSTGLNALWWAVKNVLQLLLQPVCVCGYKCHCHSLKYKP